MTKVSHEPKPEFSSVVSVDELTSGETVRGFDATEAERAAVARRLGVDALDTLAGEAALSILPSGDVKMTLKAKARVRQTCVVTLQPIETDVNIDFTTTYSDEEGEGWGHDEEEFEDLDPDIEPPEPLIEGKIDIAEACVEQLALEIDPFPRVKGATFDGYSTDPRGLNAPDDGKPNPFAVLSKLKTKQENKE